MAIVARTATAPTANHTVLLEDVCEDFDLIFLLFAIALYFAFGLR
jgi:hypothetical protein